MTGYGPGYGPFARPYFAAVLLVNSYNYSSSLWLFHYRTTLVDHLDFFSPSPPPLRLRFSRTDAKRHPPRDSLLSSPSPFSPFLSLSLSFYGSTRVVDNLLSDAGISSSILEDEHDKKIESDDRRRGKMREIR